TKEAMATGSENKDQRTEAMATRSDVVEDKGNEVAMVAKDSKKVDRANLIVAPQLVPEAMVQQKFEDGRKTRSKGKTGDEKSGQGKLPLSLKLSPTILPIDHSTPSPTTSQPPSICNCKMDIHATPQRAPRWC
ncbi:hypothetical protein Dimus_031640, partial [Dionaea muscipula]